MAFSKLLGRDANEVTPAQAGASFSEEAKRLAGEQNLDFPAAWSLAKKLHPECHARLCEGAQPKTAVANDGMAPVGFQFYLPLMQLPADTTQQEFQVAWRANGSKSTPVNKQAIFDTLVGFYVSSKKMTAATAKELVAEKFPNLLAQPASKN